MTSPSTARVAEAIRSGAREILERWEAEVQRQLDGADRIPQPLLRDHVPTLLEWVAEALEDDGDVPHPRVLARQHARQRLQLGFDVSQMVHEYALLRTSVHEQIGVAVEPRPEPADTVAVDRLLDRAVQHAVDRHVQESQRLLQRELGETDRARRLLHTLLEQMPVGVAVVEAPSGRNILHNERAIRLLGHDIGAVGHWSEYARYGALHPDGTPYAAEEYPSVRALLRGERVADEEMRYRRPDGEEVFFRIDSGPVHDAEGERIAATILFSDITETKRLEALRRAAEAELEETLERLRREVRNREQMLAIVSHDLRNPLGAVRLAAQVLLDRGLGTDPVHRGPLETILRTTGRMERLIADLLDVASIQAGRFAVERRPQALLPVLQEGLELEELSARAKGVAILRELEPLEGVTACFDRDRILQVLSNVVGNAIKFCRAGDRITVRARLRDGAVEVQVADTGPGMSEKDRARIFEPYWSAEGAVARGTGLGLHITRAIVRAHEGTIRAESTPGRGTTVSFSLRASRPRA
jgi:PAS domain S-box-containing protein